MASVRDAKKLMDRHHSLKQDFDDLFRETDALKAKLEGAKRKKSRLLAEVRFLTRRHKLLTSNSVTINIKGSINRPQNLETPSDRKSFKGDGVVASTRNHSLLDLNKVSEEDCEDVQTVWEPLSYNEAMKLDVIGSDSPNDLKLSNCIGIVGKGIGIGGTEITERPSKRKISWQDQVALKV